MHEVNRPFEPEELPRRSGDKKLFCDLSFHPTWGEIKVFSRVIIEPPVKEMPPEETNPHQGLPQHPTPPSFILLKTELVTKLSEPGHSPTQRYPSSRAGYRRTSGPTSSTLPIGHILYLQR
jgi:hypothetical protein